MNFNLESESNLAASVESLEQDLGTFGFWFWIGVIGVN
jgi:hypothetical protein